MLELRKVGLQTDSAKQDGKTYHTWGAYAQSKTANVLFSAALAEKLKIKGIQSYSVHPGGMEPLRDNNISFDHADTG
jgi:NAD(P)-dependent dehydrogenase (short-subunit alcohol dehydrogenase family)